MLPLLLFYKQKPLNSHDILTFIEIYLGITLGKFFQWIRQLEFAFLLFL